MQFKKVGDQAQILYTSVASFLTPGDSTAGSSAMGQRVSADVQGLPWKLRLNQRGMPQPAVAREDGVAGVAMKAPPQQSRTRFVTQRDLKKC